MKPLDPPPTIEGDANATEMLRLWIAHNKLNVAINIGSYQESGHDEAQAWGVILADFAKHVSRAFIKDMVTIRTRPSRRLENFFSLN
jgi:hypothetical protein